MFSQIISLITTSDCEKPVSNAIVVFEMLR
jgi:hypothetical protein